MAMALADQMQHMTDSFLQAHDLRANALKQILEETNKDLGDTRKMMRDFHTQRLLSTEEVDQAIQGFRTARKHMSGELREFLSSFVEQSRKRAAQLLRGCNTQRKRRAEAQREFLTKYVQGNAKGTRQMCRRFSTERKQRMEALREQTETFLKGVKKATHELRKGFHDDHIKARQAWQQMATSMEKKRRDGREKLAAASRPGQRGEAEGKLLELLKENPEGMTLAELSYAMDMPSAATSKILKRMMNQKEERVRKKGQVYLPS
jgi:hypothetical protein